MRKISITSLPIENKLILNFLIEIMQAAIKEINLEYVDPDFYEPLGKIVDGLNQILDTVEKEY